MKKTTMKKILGFSTAALTLTMSLPLNSFALETENQPKTEKSADISFLPVLKTKVGGTESIEAETAFNLLLNSATADAPSLSKVTAESTEDFPEKFNLCEYGLVSPVRDQGNYPTCWSFGALGSIESSLIARKPDIDLSEWHLASFTYSGDDALIPSMKEYPLEEGGIPIISTNTLAQWIGPASENLAPYDSGDIDPSLKYSSDYHLTEALNLSDYYNNRVYPDKDVIKDLLYNKHAVEIGFYYDNYFINEDTYAHFNSQYSIGNHAVLVVGWDDNYSKYNFNSNSLPLRNGAWLVKNSWGPEWGNNGYMWISYEDKSIVNAESYFVEDNDNYDNLYSYDNQSWSASISADLFESKTSYMANIFTAESDEEVNAVAFYTTDNNAEYEITVYTDLKDKSNPVSGKASKTTTGSEKYAGYHTFKLDDIVPVKASEKYSVVVKLTNPSLPYPIPVEAAYSMFDEETGERIFCSNIDYANIINNTEQNQSFISIDGQNWKDTCGVFYDLTHDINVDILKENLEQIADNKLKANGDIIEDYINNPNEQIYSHLGNVCLKALTNSPLKVDFSIDDGELKSTEAVELSADNCEAVYYTLDSSEPSAENGTLYTKPIALPEGGEIRAVAMKDGVYGNVNSHCYTLAKAAVTNLIIKSTPSRQDTLITYDDLINGAYDNEESSELFFLANEKEISFIPTTTGTLKINGTAAPSGKATAINLNYGTNKFELTVTEEGKADSTYVIYAYMDEYMLDTENERIYFNEEIYSVKLADGTVLHDGDSISEYAGKEFFRSLLNSEEEDEIIPEIIPFKYELNPSTFEINYKDGLLMNILPADKLMQVMMEDSLIVSYTPNMKYYMHASECMEQSSDYDPERYDSIEEYEQFMTYLTENSGIKVTPGKIIYLQILPSDSLLMGSETVRYIVPKAPEAPTMDMVELETVEEDKLAVKAIEGCEYAIISNDELSLFVEYTETPDDDYDWKWQDSPIFTGLSPNTDYIIVVRYAATKSSFASDYFMMYDCKTLCDDELAKINYINETISFDPEICDVITPIGNKLQNGASISYFINQKLKVVPKDSSIKSYTLSVPKRPEFPELTIDFTNKTTNQAIPDNFYATAETEFDLSLMDYMDIELILELLFLDNTMTIGSEYLDEEGRLCLEFLYGKTVNFILKPTVNSFASETYSLYVPTARTLTESELKLIKLTDTSIELEKIEGAEYMCFSTESLSDPVWQSSNVFKNLNPSTIYFIRARIAATEDSFESDIISTVITTLGSADEIVEGDVNNDGFVSLIDIAMIRKYILSDAELNETQKTRADMNEDGKINVFDFIIIKQMLIGSVAAG